MKKILLTIMTVVFVFQSNAQKKKTVSSFEMSTDYAVVKKEYKANFYVTDSLILKDGSIFLVGEKVELGESSSKMSNTYETVYIGRITLGGALMGVQPVLASTAFRENGNYILKKVKVWRSMGKTGVKLELYDTEVKGLAAKYLTASALSISRGEIINPNAPLSREQAIAKLKEAKDLMDLGMMSQEEFNALRNELTPIIMNK